MHLGLAGLLHFVRNDGILDSRHCDKASAASVAIHTGHCEERSDAAIQISKPLDCFTSFAMTARV